jgi:hypothetical protein
MFAATITSKVPSARAQAIEDAVLLGDFTDLAAVLGTIEDDPSFPPDIRAALETLLYFRLYYGKNGECEPASDDDKNAVARLETLWRQELIAMLGAYSEAHEQNYA